MCEAKIYNYVFFQFSEEPIMCKMNTYSIGGTERCEKCDFNQVDILISYNLTCLTILAEFQYPNKILFRYHTKSF